MSQLPKFFGTAGARGVFPSKINPELLVRVGKAVTHFFGRSVFSVGHDARTTSRALSLALMSGILSSGSSVVDIGLVPIGMLPWSVRKYRLSGGIYITASHNPPQYSGFKIFKKDGSEITSSEEEVFEEAMEKSTYADWSSVGSYTALNPIDEYVSDLKSSLGSPTPRYRPKIVLDTSNGPTVLAAPRVLVDMGASVLVTNGNIDGRFPGRYPEPRPDVLEPFRPVLAATGYDALFAFDGDGDRLAVLTPKYGFVKQDRLIALLASRVLMDRKGVVVISVDCGSAVRKIVESLGGGIVFYKLGKIHEAFQTHSNVVMAAEPWKFIDPRWGLWIDGIYQAAYIAKLMMEEGRSLDSILQEVPDFPQARYSVAVPEEMKIDVFRELAETMRSAYSEKAVITDIDGLRMDFEDSSWVLVRPSGTEPKIRLYAEAVSVERLRYLVDTTLSLLLKLLKARGAEPPAIERSFLA
ncbi:MAG: hypothetical protein RMH84_05670 [Sulfolobales archaeon]|nr:hypothetical protein [Sulfolobales archaeon]MCX8208907.1 hypothetical protein [Sulfolobales archaeon]MDW8011064.1 hypothetical protein [Sulfolobales archaeon]